MASFNNFGTAGGIDIHVQQVFYQVSKTKKMNKLKELLMQGDEKALVFVNTTSYADKISVYLSEQQIPTTTVHEDKMERERDIAMIDFNTNRIRVIALTLESWIRGYVTCDKCLSMTCVINFDLPDSIDQYIYRICLTSRYCIKRKTISFYDADQDFALAPDLVKLLRQTGQEVPEWLETANCYACENERCQVSGNDSPPPINDFESAKLGPLLMTNLYNSGFTKPTPIQKFVIPFILAGRDLMACTQIGSGKTTAFLIPIIQKLLDEPSEWTLEGNTFLPQAVIVTPSQELAFYISDKARKFAEGSVLKVFNLSEKTETQHQSSKLVDGCHILVATPEKLNDFVSREKVSFILVRYFVLDSVDKDLHLGYIKDVKRILSHQTLLPSEIRQTLVFSSTSIPKEILKLADRLMNNYLSLTVGTVNSATTNIQQVFYLVASGQKKNKLKEVLLHLSLLDSCTVLVFVETKLRSDFLSVYLAKNRIPTTSIHRDGMQREQEIAFNANLNRGKVLILTLDARDVHVKGVTHVINYDLPNSIDQYIHRIERASRFGNTRKAISFYDVDQDFALAPDLVKVLQQAGQKVPEWLDTANFYAYETEKCQVSGKNHPQPINDFVSTELRPLLIKNLCNSDYKRPTPIQKYGIPFILAGRDLMACTQIGSGKTTAFLIPIIQKLLDKPSECTLQGYKFLPQAVIITPSQELTFHISDKARKFAEGSVLKVLNLCENTETQPQSSTLVDGCHILVATPGKLNDCVSIGKVSFILVRYFVLDSVDRHLQLGYLDDVKRMMSHETLLYAGKRQTLVFSSTSIPKEIQQLADEHLNNYLSLTVGTVDGASTNIQQVIYPVASLEKENKLLEVLMPLSYLRSCKVLVFVETKLNSDFLSVFLSENQIPNTSIHEGRIQRDREIAFSDFNSNRVKLMVLNLDARDVHLKGVTHVINYDLPNSIDQYIYRIERASRFGIKRKAISFYDADKDSALAPDLVSVLKQAKQEVPQWLDEDSSSRGDGSQS